MKSKRNSKSKTKDHTQYRFNDKYYGKGRLVLAIIEDFVQQHNNYSYNDLERIFYKELQGSVGVIGKYNDIIEKYEGIEHKRHFINNAIQLQDGEKIVVSTEWGKGNINKFIERALELGYKIE